MVTLFGMVPSTESKTAEVEARKVGGVVSVNNQLQIVPESGQPAVEARDEVVEEGLKKNLAGNPDLSDVKCEVKNCVARLTGSVASGVRRVEAMPVARATGGVCSVTEDLTIR